MIRRLPLLALLTLTSVLEAQEPAEFDGRVLRANGEVLDARFLLKPEGRKGPEVRQVFKSRKPLIRDVVLLVDDGGVLRFPFEASLEMRADFGLLAQGNTEGDADIAAQAAALLKYSTALMPTQRELGLALLGDALELHPDVEAGAPALAALSAEERLRIWRAILAEHPSHPATCAVIAELLPEELRPEDGEPLAGLVILDFLRAIEDLGAHYVFDPDSGPDALDIERRKLGTARVSHVWGRPDLLGFRTKSTYLITPVRDLVVLQAILRRSESVNSALESIFADQPVLRGGDEMMMVYFFESRDEYLALGENLRYRGMSENHALTAGMFFGLDRTSRFFLPDGPEPMQRLLGVLSHELTHHWIFTRCRSFTIEQAVTGFRTMDRPGYWIVEGFASFVEELVFNDAAGTFSTKNPRADRLDTVAQAPAGTLVPWPALFVLNTLESKSLGKEPVLEVPISWRKNFYRRMSQWGMFYAQSAAACHFLFTAKGGKYRPKLLKYIADYYSGRSSELDVAKAFGFQATALGVACRKHAKR